MVSKATAFTLDARSEALVLDARDTSISKDPDGRAERAARAKQDEQRSFIKQETFRRAPSRERRVPSFNGRQSRSRAYVDAQRSAIAERIRPEQVDRERRCGASEVKGSMPDRAPTD